MRLGTLAILFGVMALLGALGLWLWTPDLSRAELEARYAAPPSTFIDVLGVRMHVRDTGPRDAPVVLFIHGFGSSLQTWDAWANQLAGFRVVRFDLPGFALTGADPSGDYTDERSIDLVSGLLDALGIARATVVGHSLGGRIAWRFAAARPDRTERLVLMAPDGFASPGFQYGKAPEVPKPLGLMRVSMPVFTVKMNLAPGFVDPSVLDDALVRRYHDLLRAPGVRQAILDRLAQTVLQDPRPILRTIDRPVLLLWGEQDRMVPFANAREYLEALPDARLAALPGLGHLPQEEAPAASLSPLAAFLGR